MKDIHRVLPKTTLETRDLRLVRAIEEAGAATRAARWLGISQSAVSHQLKNLEQRLGVALFERRGRALLLTAAGEQLLDLSRRVLEPIASTEATLRGTGSARRELRVSTQCFTAYHWLPRAFVALSERYPEVDLCLLPEFIADPVRALAEGRLDLALCMTPCNERRFARLRLFEDELVAVMSAKHPLARARGLSIQDLCKETLFVSELPPSTVERVKKRLFPRGGEFRRVVRLPGSDAILELVRAGLGVTITAEWVVAAQTGRGELAARRLGRAGLKRDWLGVFENASALADPIRALLAAVRQSHDAERLSSSSQRAVSRSTSRR